MVKEGMLREEPTTLLKRLDLSEDFNDLAQCRLVIESIVEDVETKKKSYRTIEPIVQPIATIGSNTSAIPITLLQRDAKRPERFVGIHWETGSYHALHGRHSRR
jgi:3-hydroxybutyryl-CoA dehydrogenase